MSTGETKEPTPNEIMKELKDIKSQLAKSKEAFNKALYLTPLAFGATLIAMGFHNDVVFWVVGGLGFVVAIIGVIWRRRVKEG